MTENWKSVLGWEGLYEVSDQGRVRSLPRPGYTYGGTRRRIWKGRMLSPIPSVGYSVAHLHRTIRRRVMAGEYQRTVAKDFGIGQQHVSRLHRGQRWQHLFIQAL